MRVIVFTYSLSPRSGRPLSPFQQRDGFSRLDLHVMLAQLGHEPGEVRFNYPGSGGDGGVDDLDEDDLIVITTRLPLDDEEGEERRPVLRSGSKLEEMIFAEMRRYFTELRRSQIVLTEPLAACLQEPYGDRACIDVRTLGGANYMAVKPLGRGPYKPPPAPNLTPAFFIRTPPIKKGGPCLLIAFGMSGTETLVWIRLLRDRYARLVQSQSPVFVMAELTIGDVPDQPDDLSFAETWGSTIIIEEPLPLRISRREKQSRTETAGRWR